MLNSSTEFDRNWLFYLVNPVKLSEDADRLSVSDQLSLLRQFLSQAELTDRKAVLTAITKTEHSGEVDSTVVERGRDQSIFDYEPDSSLPYRKSAILNALALQLAASLKFSLNLFTITCELPVRLQARLYRALVTFMSKNSSVLLPFFDQATDKDNIFIVNPYSSFTWSTLHSTTIYALMSYHLWCLQIFLTSNLLPHPFRNLTPTVAGLTEVPDSAFFAENRMELGVILGRIEESVALLTDILSHLDSLSVARPLPKSFPIAGPGLSHISANSGCLPTEITNSTTSTLLTLHSEPLSKPRLSVFLNFVLGRHAFQKQQFDRAEELLFMAFSDMIDAKLDYVEEVGATPHLLEVYLKACKSQKPEQACDNLARLSTHPGKFIEAFCQKLELALNCDESSDSIFWTEQLSSQPNDFDYSLRSAILSGKSESITPTVEDHLIQLLLEDLHLGENTESLDLVMPIGNSLRTKLERLCLEYFEFESNRSSKDTSPHRKQFKSERLVDTSRTGAFAAAQQLYTKILVCNTIERLVNGHFSEPARLATLLLTTPSVVSSKKNSDTNNGLCHIDALFGANFLLDCLGRFLQVASTRNIKAFHDRRQFVQQFVIHLLHQGIILLGSSLTAPSSIHPESTTIRNTFTRIVYAVLSHYLFPLLSNQCQSFVRSVSSYYLNNAASRFSDGVFSTIPITPSSVDPTPSVQFGLGSLAREFRIKSQIAGHSIIGRKLDVAKPEDLFNSCQDVDMRNLSSASFEFQSTQHSANSSAPFGRAFAQGDELCSDPTSVVSNSALIHLLLTTYNPNEVNTTINSLLSFMPANRILELNSAWLPTIHRMLTIGATVGPSLPLGSDDYSLDALLAQASNPTTLCIVLVQLAKAALLLQSHSTCSISHVRPLLIVSMNGLASPSISHSLPSHPGRTNDAYKLLRAAAQHELLLSELLEVLDPAAELDSQNETKKNSSTRRFQLNDLSRRCKICLFHAAGLHSSASELETKLSSSIPVGLSMQLVCAATRFLLMNQEQNFLLPTAKQMKPSGLGLPKGPLSSRGHYLGPLELVRALLRLHRAVSAYQAVKVNPEPASGDKEGDVSTTSDGTDDVTGRRSGGPQSHSLKTAINNLWNLLIFGCLVPELAPQEHQKHDGIGSSGTDTKCVRPQIQLSALLLVAQSLACTTSTFPKLPSSQPSETRWQLNEFNPRRHISLCLLDYLVFCMAHITHAVVSEFRIPDFLGNNSEAIDLTDRQDQVDGPTTTKGSNGSLESERSTQKHPMKRKRSRWGPPNGETETEGTQDSGGHTPSLLFSSLWPTDVPSNVQVSFLNFTGLIKCLCVYVRTPHEHQKSQFNLNFLTV
ncbi:unnamed protein product [Dicrocoelium dendriticum]|nr:unnamed protein product [Dicrocoelium dendriticum]